MKYVLLSLFVLLTTSSFAGRIMIVPPVENISGWLGGVCSLGVANIFTFRNIGNVPQTIKVRTLHANLKLGAKDAAVTGGGWVLVPGSNDEYTYSKDFTAPLKPVDASASNPTNPHVLTPANTGVSHHHFGCEVRKTGITNCDINTNAFYNGVPFPSAEMLNITYLLSGKVFYQIEIDESEGSVIATLMALGSSSCGGGANHTIHNVLVNGGRPF